MALLTYHTVLCDGTGCPNESSAVEGEASAARKIAHAGGFRRFFVTVDGFRHPYLTLDLCADCKGQAYELGQQRARRYCSKAGTVTVSAAR